MDWDKIEHFCVKCTNPHNTMTSQPFTFKETTNCIDIRNYNHDFEDKHNFVVGDSNTTIANQYEFNFNYTFYLEKNYRGRK